MLWPTPTALHVSLATRDSLPGTGKTVRISREQYRRLVDFVLDSVAKSKNGPAIPIEGAAYHNEDAFFQANGHYHCFYTCNSWVGSAMRHAGIRTGWYNPLPKTMLFYID